MNKLWLLLALLLPACAGVQPSAQGGTPKQFLPRQILVTLPEARRGQWQAIDQDLQARHGLRRAGEFPLASIRVNCLVYQVPEGQSVERAVQALSADPRVRLAQPNQVFEGLQAGADPYAPVEYGPRLIRADQAHGLSTGRRVAVAVIDTGADPEHPDLKGRIVKTQNFVEGGEASFAGDRHGLGVAGVIAARANDGIGMYGVAPDSEVTALKACWHADPARGKAACASWTLAKAIDFAINAGSRVINLSLSGPPDELLRALLEAAHRKGIVVVAAAAEDKPQPGFPAALETVVAVVSADAEGRVAAAPWLPQRPALAAPGVEILTAAPNRGYDFLSGSSLAAAHVTGAVALLLQQRPRLTPDEVRQILWQTGRPARADAVVIDACRALASAAAGPACR